MRLRIKIASRVGGVLCAIIALFVACVGPWPITPSGFEGTDYFNRDIAAIDQRACLNQLTDTPGRLQAGWGTCSIHPEPGLPMAGYGVRQNIREYLFGDKPTGLSTGVHDNLQVKALALSDGHDVAVLVGADLLLVPPNVAETVRREVAKRTPLSANNILFGASHTHNGPGAWGAGLAAFFTAGTYDPKVPALLTEAFTRAIVEAYGTLGPAKLAHGNVDAEKFIRNRRHKAPIDTRLGYLIAEKENGQRCVMLRFSAHPTTVGSRDLQMTAEYPGYLQTTLEKAMPNTTVAYLGGSLGSSGPRAPDGTNDIDRAQAMGKALAKLFEDNVKPDGLNWLTDVDIATVGIPLALPPFQMRMAQRLRASPLLPKLLGIPHEAWMQAVRVGDLFIVGVPGDLSGEISVSWTKWANDKGYDLWATSFCAAYVGYISPDKYYNEPKSTTVDETGFMSWTGPHQEAFFTALMKHMTEALQGKYRQR